MDRINTPNTILKGGKRQFKDGEPSGDIPEQPTAVNAEWLNGVQEEICNVIEKSGANLSQKDNGQLTTAVTKMIEEKITKVFQQEHGWFEEIQLSENIFIKYPKVDTISISRIKLVNLEFRLRGNFFSEFFDETTKDYTTRLKIPDIHISQLGLTPPSHDTHCFLVECDDIMGTSRVHPVVLTKSGVLRFIQNDLTSKMQYDVDPGKFQGTFFYVS